jgi:hypothetical protein
VSDQNRGVQNIKHNLSFIRNCFPYIIPVQLARDMSRKGNGGLNTILTFMNKRLMGLNWTHPYWLFVTIIQHYSVN